MNKYVVLIILAAIWYLTLYPITSKWFGWTGIFQILFNLFGIFLIWMLFKNKLEHILLGY